MNREAETEVLKLVRRAQSGDEQSFAQIFDLFFDKIFRYVRFRVAPEEAEDLTGEIFLKVVEKLNQYKPQQNVAFSAWIFRVAHNTVVDFYRKKRELLGLTNDDGKLNFDVMDDAPLPQEVVQKSWEHSQIHAVLEKLPSGHREILELKFLEDFSNAEISKITGKSEGNVRVIQLRALREMRKLFPDK